jgi:hypothetical protein
MRAQLMDTHRLAKKAVLFGLTSVGGRRAKLAPSAGAVHKGLAYIEMRRGSIDIEFHLFVSTRDLIWNVGPPFG